MSLSKIVVESMALFLIYQKVNTSTVYKLAFGIDHIHNDFNIIEIFQNRTDVMVMP